MSMIEVSKEKCLLDMPDEILFEIFSRLPIGKLFEVSRLHSKLRDVSGNTRLWKDAYIKYKPYDKPRGEGNNETFAVEELYSGPCPVKVVDLSDTKINKSVSSQIGKVVKVTRLNMTSMIANKITMGRIFAKYQCTELNLNYFYMLGVQKPRIINIAPEAFLKQTNLEVLSLSYPDHNHLLISPDMREKSFRWLTQVLSNCKNLKSLDLSDLYLPNCEMILLVQYLPTSLEKLLFSGRGIIDFFYKTLAERLPNLKEVEALDVTHPSLLKFQFLEALHITPANYRRDTNDYLYRILIRFPALRTIHIDHDVFEKKSSFRDFRTALESHGIGTVIRQRKTGPQSRCAVDGNFWLVSKPV